MTEIELFENRLKEMCKNQLGDGWKTRYHLHNWKEWWEQGYREETAHEAYNLAIEYE